MYGRAYPQEGGGGGAYVRVKIIASETTAATNTIRQNEHPYLKKNRRKCIVLFIYFLIKKQFISEIVPLAQKSESTR